jgi:outer membrane protein TolC
MVSRFPAPARHAILVFLSLSGIAAAVGQPLELTMQDVVDRATESSYALSEAQKRIATAQSYLDRSGAWLASNPHVSAGGAAADSKFSRFEDGPTERFGPSYTFTLQQDFEIAGQRSLRMDAARRGLDIAHSDRLSRLASVTAEAKKAFTAALEADAKGELATASTRFIQEVNAGFDPKASDTEAQRINYNTSTMQLLRQRRRQATAERERSAAYIELKRIAAIPPEHSVVLVGELESQPRSLPPLAELLDKLGERRGDVRAYRDLLTRADAELALAKRSAIPDVSLFAFVSRFDGGDDTETSGGGSLGISLPIFQGNGPSVSEAIAERQRAAAELDDLVRTVEANLVTIYGNCEDAAVQLQLINEGILPRARENLRLQRRRAQGDEVTSYDVIDYELELISAREEQVTARRVYTDALIDLEKAAVVTLVGPDSAPTPASEDQHEDPDE